MTSKPPAFDVEQTISVTAAAELLQISGERIRQLVRAGQIEMAGRGRVTLSGVVRGYVKSLKDAASETSKSSAASRVTDARTREIELRIAEKERSLIPIEDAEMALSQLAGVVIAEMSGLPARIGRDMAVRRKAEAELHGARERIADALARLSGAARTGDGLHEASA